MNLLNTYIRRSLAALTLSGFMLSCSMDQPSTAHEDDLPTGKHPLSFVASVGQPATRVGGKNFWKDEDVIGVRIISQDGRPYPMVGKYKLNADGTVKSILVRNSYDDGGNIIKSDSLPLEWPYTKGAVTAWFPCELQTNISIADQSEGYEQYDYLRAEIGNQTYKNTVDLEFKHRMAKVACKVIPSDGLTAEELMTSNITIAGYTRATCSETSLTGAAKGWIKAWKDPEASDSTMSVFEALLVPQKISGEVFIKLDITTKYENVEIPKTLTYTPAGDEANLEPGKSYIYTLRVKKDRLEVETVTAEWEDEVEMDCPTQPYTFKVSLQHFDETLLNSLKYSSNVTIVRNGNPVTRAEEGCYLSVRGQEFTLSFPYSAVDGDRQMGLPVTEGLSEVKRLPLDDGCVFSYRLLSEETIITAEHYAEIGDILYSDGTWDADLRPDKIPVGIVFRNTFGPGENKDRYNFPFNGYAVALRDTVITNYVSTNSSTRAPKLNPQGNTNYEIYLGYVSVSNCKKYAPTDQRYTNQLGQKAAIEHTPAVAGDNNSGWYVPCLQMMCDILHTPGLSEYFKKANGKEMDYPRYWTSTEVNSKYELFTFENGVIENRERVITKNPDSLAIRPVITF